MSTTNGTKKKTTKQPLERRITFRVDEELGTAFDTYCDRKKRLHPDVLRAALADFLIDEGYLTD